MNRHRYLSSFINVQPDPILQNRRNDIHSQLGAIESRAQAVQNLRKTIEAQIEEAYNKAMSDIEKITEQKVLLLLLMNR